jgi:hypothetical protein
MFTPAPLGDPCIPVVSQSGVRSVWRLVEEVVLRLGKTIVGAAGLLACLILGASVALGAGSSGTPAGGRIQLFVQPGNGQGNGKVLFTGAVGDYGSSSPTIGSGGKKFGTATLKKGTITIDLTAITAKVDKANPTINASTCSLAITETAAAPVVSGTGLYAGIHGTIRITESFGFIGSTYKSGPKKGKCNMSNNAPTVAEMGTVYGSGTVSF